MKYKLMKIRDFFKYDIPQGLKSYVYWYKVIWKNRWWDSNFLLKLMQHQLKLMEKNWVVNTDHEGDEEDKVKMQETVQALQRLIDEEWGCYDAHYEKWGHAELITTPIEGSNLYNVNFKKKNVKTKEDEEQESEEFRQCIFKEIELGNKDIETVFNNLKDYRKWWD